MTSIPTSPGVYRLSRPADRYDPVSRTFSRSKLSARAIKLGLYILSHRDGFTQSQDEIGRVIAMSPKTVRAALEDLEEAQYLIRHEIRNEAGHRIGTAYGITDEPMGLTGDSPPGEIPPGESPAHKKSRSRRDTTHKKKSNPSGGKTAGAAPRSIGDLPIREQRQEDAVATPAQSLALFDVPAPVKASKPQEPSAKTVTAAYVDSYTRNHPGVKPPQRSIGRVARDAKALLGQADADPGELTAAAAQMGEGQWDNLTMALKIYRERGSRRSQTRGALPALPHTHPVWQQAAREEEARVYKRIQEDDELVRWIGGDPSEVDKWVSKFPELAARFESVA